MKGYNKKVVLIKIPNKRIKPKYFIPTKFLYANQKRINAFRKASLGKKYWVSYDTFFNIKQNKVYLKNLLKDYFIVELGGFDGSALNVIYQIGKKDQIKFDYLNVDIGKNILALMKKNFRSHDNVKYSLIKQDFNDFKFISKIKCDKPKAIFFLGNTFGNFYSEEGNIWLKKINELMNPEDLLILGFDRRVSASSHLGCYNIPESKFNLMSVVADIKMPLEKLCPCIVFDINGIHGGVIVTENFIFKGKKFNKGDFIEEYVSLKSKIKEMINRVKKVGFKHIKIINSNKKHIYHLILKKS